MKLLAAAVETIAATVAAVETERSERRLVVGGGIIKINRNQSNHAKRNETIERTKYLKRKTTHTRQSIPNYAILEQLLRL